MSGDPYQTLGVKKDSSDDEIRKAYRRLAKKLHPDLNPGNQEAEEQFKEVSAAYDLLGDPDKRAKFDRGEIDASGFERPRHNYYRNYSAGDAANPYASDAGYADFTESDDILSEIFGRAGRSKMRMRGSDVQYRLSLDFLDAVNGAKQTLTLPDGSVLDVTIPPGTRDGQILRLRGRGRPGIGDGPPGDALIELEVHPHPFFTRKGDDIHLELPIPLHEAVLGGKVKVPTPTGPVNMTVPKWTNSGRTLRLKGKGVPRSDGGRGDEYVTFRITLPEKPDPELEKLIASWQSSESSRASEHTES